ncbi:MAG: sugar ABC transporter permease [Lachnospiraceae bacterium]|nr:sugar ABC transporter permease [Lachnospiraceae bacterium]
MSKFKTKITPYLFIAPHVILFIAFFLIPTVFGIYASFTRWNIFSDPEWIGLDNYRLILLNYESTFHRQFWNGLRNTIVFVIITVPFQIIIPLLIASLLYLKPRARNFFQAVFYLPTLLSITSVTLTWIFIFNRSLGLWNRLLGVDVNWYGQQPFAWMTIVITTLWWVIGTNMIIYVAALNGVDRSVLEAGSVDGAGGLRRFWHIMLPSIKMPVMYTVVTSIIMQFNIFGQPLMLTEGGPSESTFVLLMYIRNLAFGTGNPIAGPASAMATALGLVIGVVSVGQLIVVRKAGEGD